MIGRPPDEVYVEVAYIAYHFHWPPEELMGLDHIQRRRWVAEISSINQRMNEESAGGATPWR